jgi:hypothetical protein
MVGQPESELTGVESSNLIRDARKGGVGKVLHRRTKN